MSTFDFKKYHVRAINAATEEEKAAINAELKSMYDGLTEEQKSIFNEELQSFLVKEYAAINSMINN